MKSRGLQLTAILTFAVGAAWTVHLSRSGQSCPRPSAASVSSSGEGRLVGLVQLVRNSPYGQP
jgi:hypothetical protein